MSGFHPEVITGDTRGTPLTSPVWSSLALPCDWKWLSFILSCLDSTALCICAPASLITHLSFYTEVALVSCRFTQCCHDGWCAATFENLVFSGSTPRRGMAGSRGTLLTVECLKAVDALIYIPTQARRVPFSPHPSCIYCQIFEKARLTWPEVIPHWTSDLYFSSD